MNKTIIETDREQPNTLQTITENLSPVEDKTKEQETVQQPKKKNNNALIWTFVTIFVLLVIIGLAYYMNAKKKENETI